MGGYFFMGSLLGFAKGGIFQYGGRKGKAFRSYVGNLVASE